MKHLLALIVAGSFILLAGLTASAPAQNVTPPIGVSPGPGGIRSGGGTVMIPGSSEPRASDVGIRAHTNFEVFIPNGMSPDEGPPFSGFAFETPASLACVYRLVPVVAGCNPNTVTTNPSGGSKAIAIVDAYDDPLAVQDLAFFSQQFGLPFSLQQFTVVYASGLEPPEDPTGDWELEESLDIEYVHAMAPMAHIYLVEAPSNNLSDLLPAVVVATNEVLCGSVTCRNRTMGGGEVSMSWGSGEFQGELALDKYFLAGGVVFFAAAGDSPGVTEWPSVSPNVVAAGATSTARNPSTGNFLDEITWSLTGQGLSLYEPRPFYQNGIASIVGSQRGVPDLSFDSNPYTGLWVWDGNYYEGMSPGWYIVGGTSAATQALTGIVNAAGHFHRSSAAELSIIYRNRTNSTEFNDITYGPCGLYSGLVATAGWDLCTGVGSDRGYAGK